jgi:transcriptional regulator with XRE-family HTH domain
LAGVAALMNQRQFYAEVGRRIRLARKACTLTQESLASRVSLTRTSITNIEQGRQKFPLHMLAELADALQVAPTALLPDAPAHQDADLDQALVGRSLEEQAWIRSALSSWRTGE